MGGISLIKRRNIDFVAFGSIVFSIWLRIILSKIFARIIRITEHQFHQTVLLKRSKTLTIFFSKMLLKTELKQN